MNYSTRESARAGSRGKSIQIGLNHVDPEAYGGWDGALSGCINDAKAMQRIAQSLNFDTTILIDSEATSSRVLEEISNSALELRSGDILLMTYSGHGGQVDDVNGEEEDAKDETWVLWDRELVDDELYALWSQFDPGVRIVVLSDSCHSGTVARMRVAQEIHKSRSHSKAGTPKTKNMPLDKEREENDRKRALYNTVQYLSGGKAYRNVQASVILISGCQDNQLSSDGDVNGLFTEKVLEVWDNGAFSGDYADFHREILNMMPPDQSPNYFVTGMPYSEFEAQRPFTVEAPTGGGGAQPSTPGTEPHISATNRPTLRRGSSGQDVKDLQVLLQKQGYSIVPDGVFGARTEQAVRSFQSSYGLMADGVVGAQTWAALEGAMEPSRPSEPSQPGGPTQPSISRPTLTQGSSGEHVRYLQQKLTELQYSVVVDGVFGPRTASAVRSFQSSYGLRADGVVDPQTWAALEEAWVAA